MVYMAYRRRNRPVVARTYRLFEELSKGIDAYAEAQDLSSNAALNKLVKIALESVGITCTPPQNESEEGTAVSSNTAKKTTKKIGKRKQEEGGNND